MAETPTNITYLPIAIPPRRYLGVRASGPHPPVCHSPQMNVVHALTTIPDLRSHSVRHYPLFSLLAIVLRAAMHPPRLRGGDWGGKQDCGAHDARRRTGAGAGPPGSVPARGHSHQRRCRSSASTRRPQPVSGTSACLAWRAVVGRVGFETRLRWRPTALVDAVLPPPSHPADRRSAHPGGRRCRSAGVSSGHRR
jgi:hypothetical protein